MSIEDGLKLLERALEFELEGMKFYEKAKSNSGNPFTIAIYDLLFGEEKVHIDYLMTLQEKMTVDGKWPEINSIDIDKDFTLVYKEAMKTLDKTVRISTSETDALSHAVDLENKGRAMYTGLSEKASTPLEKKLYSLLSEWEAAHARFIEKYYNYFQDDGTFTEE
jgi:rubrerythrin